MNVTTYLKKQFSNLNGTLHYFVEDLTEEEWLARPAAGQNTLGYTVWHLPRTQDHFLQTWIRGQTEIAYTDRWAAWEHLRPVGSGIGITLEQADQVARTTCLGDVLTYADEVHQAISAWLTEIREEELDLIPDAQGRLAAFPECQKPAYIEDVRTLYDLPIWGLLMRPCMVHIHRHLGEIELTKRMLRSE